MNFDEQYLKANEVEGSTARLMYSEDKDEDIQIPESTASRRLRKTYTLDEDENEFGSSGEEQDQNKDDDLKDQIDRTDQDDEYGLKSIISKMNENQNENENSAIG